MRTAPRTRTCALLPVLALAAAHAAARSAEPGCEARLGRYAGGRLGATHKIELRHAGGGALSYFGAVHTFDPRHPQLDRIEAALAAFEPTLVFHEGHDSAIGPGREATIREHGEAGLVRLLAASAGLPARRLEPPEAQEVGYLAERFGPEKVELFFLLREATRLRERRGLTRDELEAEMRALMATRALPGISSTIRDLEALDRAFWRHWRYPRRWWQAERSWFDPFTTSAATGGVFTNEVARASAEARDLHMFRVLSRAVLAGERVFAVVGRDHLAMQAAALRCALE